MRFLTGPILMCFGADLLPKEIESDRLSQVGMCSKDLKRKDKLSEMRSNGPA